MVACLEADTRRLQLSFPFSVAVLLPRHTCLPVCQSAGSRRLYVRLSAVGGGLHSHPPAVAQGCHRPAGAALSSSRTLQRHTCVTLHRLMGVCPEGVFAWPSSWSFLKGWWNLLVSLLWGIREVGVRRGSCGWNPLGASPAVRTQGKHMGVCVKIWDALLSSQSHGPKKSSHQVAGFYCQEVSRTGYLSNRLFLGCHINWSW